MYSQFANSANGLNTWTDNIYFRNIAPINLFNTTIIIWICYVYKKNISTNFFNSMMPGAWCNCVHCTEYFFSEFCFHFRMDWRHILLWWVSASILNILAKILSCGMAWHEISGLFNKYVTVYMKLYTQRMCIWCLNFVLIKSGHNSVCCQLQWPRMKICRLHGEVFVCVFWLSVFFDFVSVKIDSKQ